MDMEMHSASTGPDFVVALAVLDIDQPVANTFEEVPAIDFDTIEVVGQD